MNRPDVKRIGHDHPVWGGRANCLIETLIDDDGPLIYELLSAERQPDGSCIICCIPGFATNLALGDLVEVTQTGEFVRVLKPSGRWVFRIWSEEGWGQKFDILDEIARLGGLMETCTYGLTAIDLESEDQVEPLVRYLDSQEREGRLAYDTGRQ